MKLVHKTKPSFIIFVPKDENPKTWLAYYMGLDLEDFDVHHHCDRNN